MKKRPLFGLVFLAFSGVAQAEPIRLGVTSGVDLSTQLGYRFF